MKMILKNGLLVLGGVVFGSIATKKAIIMTLERDRRWNGRNEIDIVFAMCGDAELVLEQMKALIQDYGWASVADLYDLADITCRNYTVNRYGWTDISSAKVVHIADGYTIEFPKPVPIK